MLTARNHSRREYLQYNVDIIGQCWMWQKTLDKDGYGKACYNMEKMPAHRMSYKEYVQDFDKTFHVLHTCDNPGCINPDHLFLGNNLSNMRDKVNKGRQLRGEAIGNSKLKGADILNIRKLREEGLILKSLAEMYNISISHVHDICRRHVWTHL